MFTERLTSIHAADSVTFAERVRISKLRSPYVVYSNCEHSSQTQQRAAPSSTCLSQSRWYHGTHIQIHTPQNFSCLQSMFAMWSFARRPQFFVVRRTVTNLSLMFALVQHVLFCSNSPLCFLQTFVGLPLTFLRRVSSSNLRFDISHLST